MHGGSAAQVTCYRTLDLAGVEPVGSHACLPATQGGLVGRDSDMFLAVLRVLQCSLQLVRISSCLPGT
jgi:hypothetical protein